MVLSTYRFYNLKNYVAVKTIYVLLVNLIIATAKFSNQTVLVFVAFVHKLMLKCTSSPRLVCSITATILLGLKVELYTHKIGSFYRFIKENLVHDRCLLSVYVLTSRCERVI